MPYRSENQYFKYQLDMMILSYRKMLSKSLKIILTKLTKRAIRYGRTEVHIVHKCRIGSRLTKCMLHS